VPHSRRTGYYLAVGVEGKVAAGDQVELIARDPARIPVAEITRCRTTGERTSRNGSRARGAVS
jgi:MOSC domain-containing protein YiiM